MVNHQATFYKKERKKKRAVFCKIETGSTLNEAKWASLFLVSMVHCGFWSDKVFSVSCLPVLDQNNYKSYILSFYMIQMGDKGKTNIQFLTTRTSSLYHGIDSVNPLQDSCPNFPVTS